MSSRRSGPNSAAQAVFPWNERATAARDAAVGNSDAYEDADAAIVPPNTSPHSAPWNDARRAVVDRDDPRGAPLAVDVPTSHRAAAPSAAPSPAP